MLTNPDFDRHWRSYTVRARPAPLEYFRPEPWVLHHPVAGDLSVHRLGFTVPTAQHRELIVYSAADDATFTRFEQLPLERGARELPLLTL